MTLWINNPNETSPWFHMRALHPHSIDVMRYYGGDITKVHAFFKRGTTNDGSKKRRVWSNVQVNMLFENGIIGHLTGSYDAGGSYGLETLELVGSDARAVIRDACELSGVPSSSAAESVTYDYLGG
jgi:predicted dehydrogenase